MRRSMIVVILAVALVPPSCSKDESTVSPRGPIRLEATAVDTCFANLDLCIAVDHVTWTYSTYAAGGFSETAVAISGSTNAKTMYVETHGDGIPWRSEVALDSSDHFNDTIEICFSHISGLLLDCGTRIVLLNDDGDSAVVDLESPLP